MNRNDEAAAVISKTLELATAAKRQVFEAQDAAASIGHPDVRADAERELRAARRALEAVDRSLRWLVEGDAS